MRSEGFLFENKAVELLEGDISRGEVSHSYLVWGPRGIGAYELAERFAAALNCTGKRKGPLGYCGECGNCSKMKEEVLVDFNVKRPTRAVRRERGADVRSSKASIKIEDVREMIEDVYIKPNEAKHKFWVMEDVHTMEERMLNSLLKVLEDPPGNSVIVLTAPSPDDLLPTVISRCRQVKMLRPSLAAVSGWLGSKLGLEPDRAEAIARAAECLPGKALAMATDASFEPLRSALLDELIVAAVTGGPFAAQRAADAIQAIGALALDEGLPNAGGPADPDSEAGRLASAGGIMEFVAAFMKDLSFLSMGYPESVVLNADRIGELAKIAASASGESWLRRAERAQKLSVAVWANANFRLALDEVTFLAAGVH